MCRALLRLGWSEQILTSVTGKVESLDVIWTVRVAFHLLYNVLVGAACTKHVEGC